MNEIIAMLRESFLKLGLLPSSANFFAVAVIFLAKFLIVLVVYKLVIKKLIPKLLTPKEKNKKLDSALNALTKLISIAYIIASIIFVFSNGISSALGTLITGSGIAAIVIGIACQDTIGNLFAGLMIFITRPFTEGDIIRYISSDITGTVENITFRHTVLRTTENKLLIIPNSVLATAPIENLTGNGDKIQLFMDFRVEYSTDIEFAMAVVKETAQSCLDAETVSVSVESFGESAIVLGMRAQISISVRWGKRTEIYCAVKKAFEQKNINFAYPHNDVKILNYGNNKINLDK